MVIRGFFRKKIPKNVIERRYFVYENSEILKMSDIYQQSLEYHKAEPHGKFSVEPTKSMKTQKDLSLAYSPGVAQPCLEIAKDPDTAYDYTNKGNDTQSPGPKLEGLP